MTNINDDIDHAKFGKGFQTDAEKKGKFVLAEDSVTFDSIDGAGGAVPVRGHSGAWPPFGRPAERLGGSDIVVINQEKGSSQSASLNGDNHDEGESSGRPAPSSVEEHKGSWIAKRPEWMCKTVGKCTPCSQSNIHFPFCQPYGNRVEIQCRRVEVVPKRPPPGSHSPNQNVNHSNTNLKAASSRNLGYSLTPREMSVEESLRAALRSNKQDHDIYRRQEAFVSGDVFRGYQICGRSQDKEAWDYAEFVSINLIVALAALYVLLIRQRTLAQRHQSMLARRIGRS